jgi:hypothetical protein
MAPKKRADGTYSIELKRAGCRHGYSGVSLGFVWDAMAARHGRRRVSPRSSSARGTPS